MFKFCILYKTKNPKQEQAAWGIFYLNIHAEGE